MVYKIFRKVVLLIMLSITAGLLAKNLGLNPRQVLTISVFSMSILGTLLFWDFRLSFAFFGTSILLITRTLDLENLIRFSSLEIILFLIGMMVIIGMLKDAGFFAWVVSLILRMRNFTAKKFVLAISITSMLLAGAVDETTSIIFIVAAVLEICDYFEVNPTPYIIISVFATNIGSMSTVLGNPIGILIATKSGLTFEDFILKAFPLAIICLIVAICISIIWFRKSLKELDLKIKEVGDNEMLIRLISIPPEKETKIALLVFILTLFGLAFSHRLDLFWGLETNTILLIIPLFVAGIIMIWKSQKARKFIEKDVEWWTLLFFLFLFAQAGALKYTSTTDVLAKKLTGAVKNNASLLMSVILWLGGFASSVLDNVVLVAAVVPIIQSFKGIYVALQPFWWALLFGGCLGGNITLVGSTANIVAIGILEKERHIKIHFFNWFWIGLIIGILTIAITWLAILIIPFYRG